MNQNYKTAWWLHLQEVEKWDTYIACNWCFELGYKRCHCKIRGTDSRCSMVKHLWYEHSSVVMYCRRINTYFSIPL